MVARLGSVRHIRIHNSAAYYGGGGGDIREVIRDLASEKSSSFFTNPTLTHDPGELKLLSRAASVYFNIAHSSYFHVGPVAPGSAKIKSNNPLEN